MIENLETLDTGRALATQVCIIGGLKGRMLAKIIIL